MSADLPSQGQPAETAGPAVAPAEEKSHPSDEPADVSLVRRVARNTAGPFAATLLSRGLSYGLASVAARLLGPAGVGAYYVAQNLWFFASVVADFGLSTLLTREVARDRSAAPRVIAATLALRLGLATLCAPILVLAALAFRTGDPYDNAIVVTVALLAAGLFPGAVAGALSALFSGYERMSIPAGAQLVTGALTAGLGVAALVLGWGIIGLGVVSLVVGIVTAALFLWLTRHLLFRPAIAWDRRQAWADLREAWPLMLNSLLNGLFFRIDIQVLKAARGNSEVGNYGNAYRIIDAVGLIPSSFVLALFPILSRRAAVGTDAFLAVYRLALKLLLALALPITISVTIIAHDLVYWLYGPKFVPQAAIALQVLIWYVPGSFWNGLAQYVLISLGLQRRITTVFVLGTVVNLVANLLLVPRFGLIAAASTTVASEAIILIPFAVIVRRRLGTVPLWPESRAPLLAGALMAGMAFLLAQVGSGSLATVTGSLLVYGASWILLRPLTATEWRTVATLWRRAAPR